MSYYVKINDEATPFLKRAAGQLPREFDRALKSVGWWLRGEIKEGIKSGAPGGQPYKPYSSITTSKKFDRRKGIWRRGPHQPMGRLYSAVQYRFYKDSRRVIVGWITRSAERLGTIQETGKTMAITPRMRRYFWASGFPLSAGKTHIYIPKRPTIGPEYIENAPKIPGYIENKIWNYLEKA